MYLPPYVTFCIDRLEQAGYPTYAVGGCVRDALLGLQPHDYDLCTAASPEITASLFPEHILIRAGEKHGTIGVVVDHQVVEITTFRTEGAYLDSRHPQWVEFVTDVRQDLARRDFTVNAMAYSPIRGFADPFGGQKDLQNHILRAVGDPTKRFTEDALRILRGVRFAVRFRLTPEAQTLQAMEQLAHRMDLLAKERIFDELCRLLPLVQAADLCRFAPILSAAVPVLAPTMGFQQHSSHHAYDVFTHTAHVVEGVDSNLTLRWAALLHDIGKVPTFTLDEARQGHFLGHAQAGAALANQTLLSLKAPTHLRETVVFLIEKHMTPLPADKKLLRRRLSQYGLPRLELLLQLQKADFCAKGVSGDTADFAAIEHLLQEILAENACLTLKDLALNGHDLLALGYEGPAIGKHLQQLLELVLDERIENEKAALLAALKSLET